MDRLSYYTSLASISGLTDLREIEEEMKDRFGVLPMLVKRLFRSAELKFFASYAMFQRMVIQQGRIIIVLPPADDEEYYQAKFPLLAELLMGKYKGKIKLVQKSQSLQLQIEQSFNVPEAAIEFLTAFAKEAAALYGAVSDDAPVVLEA
jgi:transcription-repair coupling factor (superfamily II helicase)